MLGTAQQIRNDRSLRATGPFEINIDLGTAQEVEFTITGNKLYITDSPDQSSYIQIKKDGSDRPAITYKKQQGFSGAFEKVVVITPAGQAGTMTILISNEGDDYTFIDNVTNVSFAMNDIAEQLKGDVVPESTGVEKTVGVAASLAIAADVSGARKGFVIQSKSSNTGLIYVGFDGGVLSSNWVAELQPGGAFFLDDYRGDVWVIATAAAQTLGWGVW